MDELKITLDNGDIGYLNKEKKQLKVDTELFDIKVDLCKPINLKVHEDNISKYDTYAFIIFMLFLGSAYLALSYILDYLDKDNIIDIIIAGIFLMLTIKLRTFQKRLSSKIKKRTEKTKEEILIKNKPRIARNKCASLLYVYLKQNIPTYRDIKDKHQFIQSDVFEASSMDSLMCQMYIKAFLLDATGIIITQSNISNEVNGASTGYITGGGNSPIRGNSSGYTSTETTYHASVTFVKNK